MSNDSIRLAAMADASAIADIYNQGFREVGVYEKHGRLDGRWLDVVVVERLIPENLTSSDHTQE